MSSSPLKKSFTSIFFTFFLSYLAILFVSVGSVFFFNYYEERHVAHLLSVSIRNDLVTGDFRSAIVALSQSIPSEFLSISYSDIDGGRVFEIPSNAHAVLYNVNKFSSQHIETIFAGDGLSPMGNLIFSFSRTRGILVVFGGWVGLLLMSIPFLKRARNKMLEKYNEDVERQQNAALAQLARQVAHDIRSPLAALNIASNLVTPVSEETQNLLLGAITRINDISNQLLLKNGERSDFKGTRSRGLPAVLVSTLLNEIVSEKRLEFITREDLVIENELDTVSRGLHIHADPIEFKRMISNLVNNSVESIETNGKIRLNVLNGGDCVELIIEDNGRGISPEILSKLGKRGQSYDKVGGSGLGVFHAKNCMKQWGGNILFSSELGKGTVVVLKFPKKSSKS